MITFTLCLLALIAGYFIYGRFIERVFGPIRTCFNLDMAKHPPLPKPMVWITFHCLLGKSL